MAAASVAAPSTPEHPRYQGASYKMANPPVVKRAAPQAGTWGLVPLKSSHRAKSRLSEVLGPREREQLFFTLAERVIRALGDSGRIDAVAVVTSSRKVAAFARALGATPILQTTDFGMSPALELGLHSLQSACPARVLMLPGDLPSISAAAVDKLLSAADANRNMVLVPDRHREGTNALLCTPPLVITPRFGQRSFERHLAAAEAAGIGTRILEIDELALDLDRADDLEYLRARDCASSRELFDSAMTVAPGGV